MRTRDDLDPTSVDAQSAPKDARSTAGSPPTTVAVVITTYNHAHYLGEAIESVLAQIHPADEIIVVDDGSADAPDQVTARYPSVRLIRQKNQGLAGARNTGLRAAASAMIVFLDADDRLLPNALAAGLECLAQAPQSVFAYGGHRHIRKNGTVVGADLYDPIGASPYLDLLRGNLIAMHATVMYRRAALLAAGGFDTSLKRCEDYDIYLRLARSHPIVSHPNTVAEYRWHGTNMSANNREMLSWVLRVHRRQLVDPQKAPETAAAWRHGQSFWRSHYCDMIIREFRERLARRDLPGAVRSLVDAARSSPWRLTGRMFERAAFHVRRVLPDPLAELIQFPNSGTPPIGVVRFGDFNRVVPISGEFGYDRGTPIDRYYIEAFLTAQRADIGGWVLEVGDDSYTRRFGGAQVTHRDVLHVHADNPQATIVGDLSRADVLPSDAFDCMVLTQTLHLIYDMPAAIREIHRALKPGGIALVTVPGITQIDRGEWGSTWYWSLTPASARRLFGEVFGPDAVTIQSYGNVFAATAFLQGLALEEVKRGKLDVLDPAYPVTIALRAMKARTA